ncbi:hypothetical protein [Pseudomonas sp. GM80]|uniref:hypothetical protein n=1 Tax=Pseudomonas sp. GM80 TaxID=1144339 RepID=UPI00026F8CD3|nr:hypothetical protein [Pseudomonas sp. GM80]EJN18638.1 hypothetical protein PMI37_05668 [Pseudomonas sp. GM80]
MSNVTAIPASRGQFSKTLRLVLWLLILLLVATLAFFAWQSFYPVQAAGQWSYRVIHGDVPKAAALVVMDGGGLMVSQELRDGRGSIVRIAGDGQRESVVSGLSKPDGMISARGGWVFSQEEGAAAVNFLLQGKVTELFHGSNVQGLWNEGDHLYAIEDRHANGRLFRYTWSDQSLVVLRDGLDEAESIIRCTDSRMLYTEKDKGVVRHLSEDGSDPIVFANLNQPTFLMCDQRGLWISEDSTHRARLLLIGNDGVQRTILSFLKAPQSIVASGRGTYLLAEGGRNRVLELTPPSDQAR